MREINGSGKTPSPFYSPLFYFTCHSEHSEESTIHSRMSMDSSVVVLPQNDREKGGKRRLNQKARLTPTDTRRSSGMCGRHSLRFDWMDKR